MKTANIGKALVGLGVCWAAPAVAAEGTPSVDEIVNNANRVAYYQGADGRAQVTMTITDSQGRTRNREFTILRWDKQPAGDPVEADRTTAEQKFYVYFHRPADVNKMVFMVWKHLDKDDDRWLYLPALDLVKRIAASDERTSFVGSDFFYEDVSGRGTHEDHHELVKTTTSYFVLKNTPKKPDAVEFAYYEMWIHRKTYIPVHIYYTDKKGQKYRHAQVLGVKNIQGYPTVVKARMTDLRTKANTVVEYRDVTYDVGLPEDMFTERYLRNPPQKFLK